MMVCLFEAQCVSDQPRVKITLSLHIIVSVCCVCVCMQILVTLTSLAVVFDFRVSVLSKMTHCWPLYHCSIAEWRMNIVLCHAEI